MTISAAAASLLMCLAWQSTLLLAMTWLSLKLLRRRQASLRHALIRFSTVGLCLLPVIHLTSITTGASWSVPISWMTARTQGQRTTADDHAPLNSLTNPTGDLLDKNSAGGDSIDNELVPARHQPSTAMPNLGDPAKLDSNLDRDDTDAFDSERPSDTTSLELVEHRKIEEQSVPTAPAITSTPLIDSPNNSRTDDNSRAWNDAKRYSSLMIVSTWLAGVIVLALWRVATWNSLRRVLASSVDCGEVTIVETLQAQASRLGIHHELPLRIVDHAIAPAVVGWYRPTLVLPVESRSWTTNKLSMVLEHELSHVSRHDLNWLAAMQWACVLYWFQPLAWLIQRHLRLEQENECDDRVISAGHSPTDYAETLLQLAKSQRVADLSTTVSMARSTTIERRITSILDPQRSHAVISKTTSLGLLAIVVAATILLGTLSAFQEATPQTASDSALKPSATQDTDGESPKYTYQQKPISYWTELLETDLDIGTQQSAVAALDVFAVNGYREEVMASLKKVMQRNISRETASACVNTYLRHALNPTEAANELLEIGGEETRRLSLDSFRDYKARPNSHTFELAEKTALDDLGPETRYIAAIFLTEGTDSPRSIEVLATVATSLLESEEWETCRLAASAFHLLPPDVFAESLPAIQNRVDQLHELDDLHIRAMVRDSKDMTACFHFFEKVALSISEKCDKEKALVDLRTLKEAQLKWFERCQTRMNPNAVRVFSASANIIDNTIRGLETGTPAVSGY